MRKFDTKVQYLKYKVLRQVAHEAWNDTLLQNLMISRRRLCPVKPQQCVAVFTRNAQFSANV